MATMVAMATTLITVATAILTTATATATIIDKGYEGVCRQPKGWRFFIFKNYSKIKI